MKKFFLFVLTLFFLFGSYENANKLLLNLKYLGKIFLAYRIVLSCSKKVEIFLMRQGGLNKEVIDSLKTSNKGVLAWQK